MGNYRYGSEATAPGLHHQRHDSGVLYFIVFSLKVWEITVMALRPWLTDFTIKDMMTGSATKSFHLEIWDTTLIALRTGSNLSKSKKSFVNSCKNAI
jgi:hypothetical protein